MLFTFLKTLLHLFLFARFVFYYLINYFITARRYISAVEPIYAVVVCPSVRLSVCLSHADIVPKRLNLGSRKQRHTISQGL